MILNLANTAKNSLKLTGVFTAGFDVRELTLHITFK